MVTEALLKACISSDARAQQQLYKVLYPVMMAICTRYERDRGNAVANMNAAFLKILRGLDRRPPTAPFEPWMRRITINTAIDAFRRDKEWKRTRTIDETMDGQVDGHANDYLRVMEAEAFADLLQRVPSVSRHVFNLFAIDGFSHAEIAGLLDISEGTSKWHVNHARSILRKAILARAEADLINHQQR